MKKISETATTAEQWAAEPPAENIWERRLVEHFIRRLPQGASVLVLGWGLGDAAAMISAFRPDLRWEGVDYSPAAVNLHVFDLNSSPWPFLDRQFDAVIAGDILEYLEDPRAALAECIRIASKMVVASFAREAVGRPGIWLFEPQDPWKLLAGTDLKVHHLREGRLMLAFAGIKS